MDKQWFVFYTKSRQEKKVLKTLEKYGYRVYLPMHTTLRQWSDRKKRVQVPLFSSYIFVFEHEHKIPTILAFPGVAWLIKYNDKPAVLRNEELALIERFINTGLPIQTAPMNQEEIRAGDKAEIIGGPLAGLKGILTGDAANQKFTMQIEALNQIIQVQIPVYLLKKG